LGSGIGNVVLQIAAETRSRSYGVELLSTPSNFARAQLAEFKARLALYGRECGVVHLRQADFLEDAKATKVIEKADVLFVQNYAFGSKVDNALIQLFPGMKEGSIIISFRAFRALDYNINEFNMGEIASILTVQRIG